MRCSEFRDLHCDYLDDTLAGVELVRVQEHLTVCPPCAAYDASVRRALMLVRNLPPIEPSPDFARRLEARLAEERAAPKGSTHDAGAVRVSFRRVAAVCAAASLVMLGYMADSLYTRGATPPRVASSSAAAVPDTVAPVVAPTAAPAIVASVSAGVPIWPVALLAEPGTAHFASFTEAR